MESRTRTCPEIVITCSLAKIGEPHHPIPGPVWPGLPCQLAFVTDSSPSRTNVDSDVLLAFVCLPDYSLADR